MISSLWPGSAPVARGGLRYRGLLESAVQIPFQSAGGEDAYPSIEEKGAALFRSLNANHPFIDGNKRTAVLALLIFLQGNSRLWLLGADARYQLAIRTASYRERGASHEECFAEIRDALRASVISFAEIKRAAKNDPRLAKRYRGLMGMRQRVRREMRLIRSESNPQGR